MVNMQMLDEEEARRRRVPADQRVCALLRGQREIEKARWASQAGANTIAFDPTKHLGGVYAGWPSIYEMRASLWWLGMQQCGHEAHPRCSPNMAGWVELTRLMVVSSDPATSPWDASGDLRKAAAVDGNTKPFLLSSVKSWEEVSRT